jgi:hypothetical protein
MTQRDTDFTDLVGQASPSSARSFGASAPPDGPREEEQEELLDYTPVPLRNTRMLLVRFRLGTRLKPLPYSLDEEDS